MAGRKKTASGTGAKRKTYHHGDLRQALLTAAENILARDGIGGLTLRAAARETGTSHAAPKNHFDDLTGLLSELAATGFERFNDQLLAAAAKASTPQARLNATGRAYVKFAVAQPGLFQLMFRSERLDASRPALRDAMQRAYLVLTDAVDAAHPEGRSESGPHLAHVGRAWAMVHGYAMLLLDGRLTPLFETGKMNAASLLDAMLEDRP